MAEMILKAQETYFIRPIEVPIWTKNEPVNEVNYNIYYSILEHLEKKKIFDFVLLFYCGNLSPEIFRNFYSVKKIGLKIELDFLIFRLPNFFKFSNFRFEMLSSIYRSYRILTSFNLPEFILRQNKEYIFNLKLTWSPRPQLEFTRRSGSKCVK